MAELNGKNVMLVGLKGDKGATGAKIVSTVLKGQDEYGGNIYEQTFDDGTTAEFVAPRGSLENIVHTTGNSTTSVMSQKSVTDAIATERVNLIDFSKAIENRYYDASSGILTIGNGSTFSLPKIPISEGTYYLKRFGKKIQGTDEKWIADMNWLFGAFLFTDSGVSRQVYYGGTRPLQVNADEKYIGFTFYNNAVNYDYAFVKSDTDLPSYVEYECSKNIRFKNTDKKTTYVVAQDGSGDFDTITAAVNACKDTSTKPYTIVVKNGQYNETLKLFGRYISLIGEDKNNCIVYTTTGDYYEPPIEVGGGNIYIANLTFKATHENQKQSYSNDNRAYAMHADHGGGNAVLVVENCKLISNQCAAVGTGLNLGCTTKFINCELIHKKDSNFGGNNYGALFAHSYSSTYDSTQDKGQNYEFINCIFESNIKGVWLATITSPFKCLFVNCLVKSGGSSYIEYKYGSAETTPIIHEYSYGNSKAELNATN